MNVAGTQTLVLALRRGPPRPTVVGALWLLGAVSLVVACSGGSGAGADAATGSSADARAAATSCPQRLAPVPAAGQTETVGSGTTASCSEQALRTALANVKSAGGGTVLFNCGGPYTITLSAPLPVGSAKDQTAIVDGNSQITISGGGTTRIFDLDNYTNFVVQRLTLRDGFVAAGEPEVTNRPSNSGAAIRHPWFGTLKAIDVRFENNQCASRDGEIGGGAIYAGGLTDAVLSGCEFVNNSASNGGGILNRGSTLTILACRFSGNGALGTGDGQYGNGGGVYIDGMNYENPGGDLLVCGTVFENNTAMTHGSGMFAYFYPGSESVVRDCLFDGNKFDNAGSGSGAFYHEAAPLTLSGTTFSHNTGGQHAGSIFLGQNSEAFITNCTFAANRVSGNAAGLFNGAAIAHLINCTFSGNDADYGPAIFKGSAATVTLKNTLFAANTTANQYSATSCHEAMTDLGGNLQWPQTKASGNPDQPCVAGMDFADPLLQSLADNGGFSMTFALGPGSPAIDRAADCPATDQRGQPRGTLCDTGAYEAQP
jgi:predicted outer membrane repeat protein